MPDAAESVAVKVALAAFSLDVVTSLIDKLGAASSSAMVSVPVASLIEALEALESVNVAVSLLSSVLSANTGTVKVFVVSPAAKVSVSETAVKSSPEIAVPPAVA